MGNLLDKMKTKIKTSGSAKGQGFYIKPDTKKRIRFLIDLEDAIEVIFHDSYEQGINQPCLKHFDMDCEYCDNEDIRTRPIYIFPVYDYEDKQVKLIQWAANSFSPLTQLIDYYEEDGTITKKDFVLKRTGSKLDTTYTLMPKENSKFKVKGVEVPDEKEVFKLLALAANLKIDDNEDSDIEDEDESFDVDEDWESVDEVDFDDALKQLERKDLWKISKLLKVNMNKSWKAEKMARCLLAKSTKNKIKKAVKHFDIDMKDDIPF